MMRPEQKNGRNKKRKERENMEKVLEILDRREELLRGTAETLIHRMKTAIEENNQDKVTALQRKALEKMARIEEIQDIRTAIQNS